MSRASLMDAPIRNPEQVFVVDLAIDTSGSTLLNGAAEQIQAGLAAFVTDLQNDPILANAVELGVVAFGQHTTTERLVDFGPIRDYKLPQFTITGATPLCELLMKSVADIAQRQHVLRQDCDQDIRQAWLFMFTDGGATDSNRLLAAQRARDEATRRNIAVFLIGVGENADLEFLGKLAQPKRRPLRLAEVEDFAKFFRWLYVSLRKKSTSQPDEEFELPDPINGDDQTPGWAANG